MCEPTTIALAISAVSAAAGVHAQNQQVKAVDRSNKRQGEAAMTAYHQNLANMDVESQQRSEDVATQIATNNIAGAKANSTARMSAEESGISGISVDALLREISGMNSTDNVNASTQYLRNDTAMQSRRTNVYNQTASTFNTMQTPAGPDYLGAALKIGSAYGTYKSQQPKT